MKRSRFDMNKVILPGVIGGLALAFVYVLFTLVAAPLYMINGNLWKILIDLWFFSTAGFQIFVGLLYAGAFEQFEKGLPGKDVVEKGISFGTLAFVVGVIPSVGTQWFMLNIPDMLLFVWLLQGLIGSMLAGVVISIIRTAFK